MAVILAGMCLTGGTGPGAAPAGPPYSPLPSPVRPAGLWNKPNQACMDKCQVFVNKDCFTELRRTEPSADPASLQERCEAKYSLCLYDCMCDTCDEKQIIIKTP